ncbi:MAG: TRAP transporter substrate-binding protein [Rhodospirillaceae bacterium]|nr:TRAP transporter substrate-binding protein [Rhodospirillaceae bacterium]
MYRLIVLGFAIIAAMFSGALNLAVAKDVNLKFAHWVPATHPLHKGGWAPWAKSIEKASGGSIKISFFPAGQLGKPPDHYDLARDGIADFGWLNPGFNTGRWVIASAGTIPLLVNDGLKASAALDEWYEKYASVEMSDVKMCMLHNMHPGTIFTKKQIKVPQDFKGLKYRASNSMEALFVRNNGGAIVNVPQPAIKEVLRRGVADGTFNALNSIISWGIHKEVKYVVDMPWGSPVFSLVMNKKKYNGLSADQRKIIDDHCSPEWSRKFITAAVEFEKKGPAKLKAAGLIFHKPSPSEYKIWKNGVIPVKKAWAKEVSGKGHNADKIYSDLLVILKKYGALLE